MNEKWFIANGWWILLIVFYAFSQIYQGYKEEKDYIKKYPCADDYNERIPDNDCREYILNRDNYRCQCCGSNNNLEIDHILPWSRGGKTNSGNLQVLCRYHNRRKGNKVSPFKGYCH